MAYGLQVYNSSGQVRVDTTIMKGMTLVDVFKVNAGENKSKSYPEHSGRTLKANAFRLDQSGGHRVSVSGTTVSATSIILPSEFRVRKCDSLIYVFMR